jgi:hypothetical protein
MIPRSNLAEHLQDFDALVTVDQVHHFLLDHRGLRADVFSGERSNTHARAHRDHPHPDQSHSK